jgi:hypothetical protein
MALNSVSELPKRMPGGTRGQQIEVLTNHFRVDPTLFPDKIYVWDAEVRRPAGSTDPNPITERVTRRVLQLLLAQSQFVTSCSDYTKTLVSWTPLTPTPTTHSVLDVRYNEPEEPSPSDLDTNSSMYQVILSSASHLLEPTPLKNLFNNPTIHLPRANEYEDALNIIPIHYAGQHPEFSTAARGTKVFSLRNDGTRHELGIGL